MHTFAARHICLIYLYMCVLYCWSFLDTSRFKYRFAELKMFHGIEEVKPQTGAAGPQKMASGLICIPSKTFKLTFFLGKEGIIIWFRNYCYFKSRDNDQCFITAITLKCVGASFGEQPSMTKKLPSTTTVDLLYLYLLWFLVLFFFPPSECMVKFLSFCV